MAGISTDLITIIDQLLPGFLAAWIVYGLTAYAKPSPFERIVQALIFTILVRGFVIAFREAAFVVGDRWRTFGTWTEDSALVVAILSGVLVGVGLAWCVNNDFPFAILRPSPDPSKSKKPNIMRRLLNRIRLTEKTIHPSEWYSVFSSRDSYVVLHLTGERRLYGWTVQYPDNPNEGHFVIADGEWLLDDGERAPLYTVDRLLIRAKDVEWVEFMKRSDEIAATEQEIEEAEKRLIAVKKSVPREEEKHAD
jgi:hypothetical protein